VCCALLVIGLPPLPGFVAKVELLATALRDPAVGENSWNSDVFMAAILISGFISLIALSRIGMRVFWSVAARATPRVRLLEAAPVAGLIILCLGLSVAAGPVARYLEAAAQSLHQPDTYVRSVLSAQPNEHSGTVTP